MRDMEQLTIFDFLPPEENKYDIENMTTAEIAKIIGERVGVQFKPTGWVEEFGTKIKKLKLSLHKSRYACDTTDRKKGDAFISVGYDIGSGGGGSPVDSIEAAVNYFKQKLEKYKKGDLT